MIVMMKVILVALLCMVSSTLVAAELDISSLMEEAETCRTKNNMTQEEYDEGFQMKIPSSKAGKCFLFCIMHFVTALTEEGKLNIEGSRALVVEAPVSDEDKKKMSDIPELCNKEVEVVKGDKCESAHRILSCMKKKAEERGIKPPI